MEEGGTEAEGGGEGGVEGGEFELFVEEDDGEKGEQREHRHNGDRFGPEDEDGLLLREAGLPGLGGAVVAAVGADLGEFGLVVAGADSQVAAVGALARCFGAGVFGGDGDGLAAAEAVAVGVGPGDADFADHDGVFVEMDVAYDAGDKDDGDGEEEGEGEAEGGVLFDEAGAVDELGEEDGGDPGGGGADDEPDG